MTAIYEQTTAGSIRLKAGRRAWGVDVPAYVYDLWVPLIGFTAVGLYGCLCRLERDGNKVRGLTLKDLATYGRVGSDKLSQLMGMLEICGFIEVKKPEGWERLAHHATEITVLDAPSEITQETINIWGVDSDKWQYKPLTTWLIEQADETQQDFPKNPNGSMIENPNGSSNLDPYDPSLITPHVVRSGLAGMPLEGLFPTTPTKEETGKQEDITQHPLVRHFLDQTKLKALSVKMYKAFTEDFTIRTRDGDKLKIDGGLMHLYNTRPGFAAFATQRITDLVAANFMTKNEDILANLQHLSTDGKKYLGFFSWIEQYPSFAQTIPDEPTGPTWRE